MCPVSNSPHNSFFQQTLKGDHTWINPPFHLLEHAITHYLKEKALAPDTTSACILAPDWPNTSWAPLVHGMQVIATYPTGFPLFEMVNEDNSTSPIKGIPWPIKIYYDAPYTPASLKAAWHTEETPRLLMQFHCTISGDTAMATADSGATHSFMDKTKAIARGLQCNKHHHLVELADGSMTTSAWTCTATLRMRSQSNQLYTRKINFLVIDLGGTHDVILGQNWLRQEGVVLSYHTDTITLHPKPDDLAFILRKISTKSTGHMVTHTPPILSMLQAKRLLKKGARCFMVQVLDTGTPSSLPQVQDTSTPTGEQGPSDDILLPSNISANLQSVLHQYMDVFQAPTEFPKDHGIQHLIPLEAGSKPPYRPAYRLSPAETAEVDKQVGHLLRQGLIIPSHSPYGAPVLFVEKPDKSLRMVIDYRLLNAQTIKNKSPIPRMDTLLDQIKGAKVLSSCDLWSGYHQIPIHPDDIDKTQFITPIGSYSWKVMPMGVSNAGPTFQALMNKLFRQYLGKFFKTGTDGLGYYVDTYYNSN